MIDSADPTDNCDESQESIDKKSNVSTNLRFLNK